MDFKQKYFAIWQEVWELHKKYWSISADDTNLWKSLSPNPIDSEKSM